MKASIVILCWNDQKVIRDCIQSIYAGTYRIDFEIIVSDNGSTDGSVEAIRGAYPNVTILENQTNLGFARGNNAGIRVASGEYVLILNPDTIIHPGALDRWIAYADSKQQAGAFGCRVLNPDGTYQGSARPFPTVWRYWIAALYLRPLAHLSGFFVSDAYTGWDGDTERSIDWQSGCCLLFRRSVLQQLGGFDEQFFYHYEEVDLCRRCWNAGYPILFNPTVEITHLGGQSVGRFPVRFAIEKHRNRYRYFYKHFGPRGARECRWLSLAWLRVRQIGYALKHVLRPTEIMAQRIEMYKACYRWNKLIDPVRFVENGDEPDIRKDSASSKAPGAAVEALPPSTQGTIS